MIDDFVLLKAANRELNLAEYRRGSVRLESLPRFIVVELTQLCNLSCAMCRNDNGFARGRVMSDELFNLVAEELFPTAEMIDLRGWGESLILPRVIDRIRETARYGVAIRFVTNLSFRRPDTLRAVAEHNCHVAVSVDSADPEVFARLRRGGQLVIVSENLRTLTADCRRRFGTTERIHLTTTVQRPALAGLADLVDFAAAHDVWEIRLFSVTGTTRSLAIEDSAGEVDRALKDMAEKALAAGVRVKVGTRMGTMPQLEEGGPACIHPWAYAYVAYNGAVGFCDHLIGVPGEEYMVGSLKQDRFESIWNSPAWCGLRKEHIGRRDPDATLFQECAWCYRNRHPDFEDYFDPNFGPQIVELNAPMRSDLREGT